MADTIDTPAGASSDSPNGDSLPIQIEAIYENGVLRPLTPLVLPPSTRLTVRLRPTRNRAPANTRLLAAFNSYEAALLVAGLLLYALTRFVGIERFPIYFFCDEAIHPVHAFELLQRGGYDGYGTFLPTYFRNSDKFNLSLSVYLHLIGVAMFGKSVLVTRATSALVSLLACVAVALALKLVFRCRFWWAAPLVLAAIPAWFLHTRTAFEVVLMVTFYACFLTSYLLYRYRAPNYLFAAVVFGALTFYSYANGQGVMLVSALLLLGSDLRFHLRQWRSVSAGLGLLLLLALPYLRFRWQYPAGLDEHLRVVGSVWVKDVPLGEKLLTFGANYVQGLSPAYWFFYNGSDLERHRMKDMGHIALFLLPFVLLGLLVCLRNLRSAAHRAVLIALLAAPFSAALAHISITRAMSIFIPVTLLACLGIEALARWLRRPLAYPLLASASGLGLSLASISMLTSALGNGPTWYSDYTLYGMQYGASQIYAGIAAELRAAPDTRIVVTPNWANNSDVFRQFFLDEASAERVKIEGIDSYLTYKADLPPKTIFVLLEHEYQQAQASAKFVVGAPTRSVPFPDGRPGFYFVPLRYVDNIDALLAAERAERARPVETKLTIDGQQVLVRHSLLDIGTPERLFDGNFYELIRGFEANPLLLEFIFPEPRELSGFDLTTGALDFELKVIVKSPDGTSQQLRSTHRGLPPDPTIAFRLPNGPQPVKKIRLELTDLNAVSDLPTHIHVRDLSFK